MVPGIVPYGPIREGDRGTAWFDGPWDNDCGRNSAYPYHTIWPIEELWFENRYNPQGNEFTCSQNLAPAAAAYGFLCARAKRQYKPNAEPQVNFLAPAGQAEVPPGHPIELRVRATDSDGRVVRVVFFDDRHKIGEATEAPFSYTWTCAKSGDHLLSAMAVDNTGATTFSADRPKLRLQIGSP
jgi:Bacterial Ig domain